MFRRSHCAPGREARAGEAVDRVGQPGRFARRDPLAGQFDGERGGVGTGGRGPAGEPARDRSRAGRANRRGGRSGGPCGRPLPRRGRALSGPCGRRSPCVGRRSATAWRQAAAPGWVGVASRSAPFGVRRLEVPELGVRRRAADHRRADDARARAAAPVDAAGDEQPRALGRVPVHDERAAVRDLRHHPRALERRGAEGDAAAGWERDGSWRRGSRRARRRGRVRRRGRRRRSGRGARRRGR